MINNTYVCIGGPADGKRIECTYDILEVLEEPGVHIGIFSKPVPADLTHKIHIYKKEYMRVDDLDITFWVHEDVSLRQALLKLFRRYNDK